VTPDPDTREKLRKALLRRGQVLATLLSEVLAGKDKLKDLAALKIKPGIRPEEALRKALDHVEARRRLLDAGDDAFGRCGACGVELDPVAIDEMPWADRCEAHRAD
jgi:hypothetical protein